MSRSAAFLLAVVAALLGFGLVMLYSASATVAELNSRYGDSNYFLKKQLIWTLLSILALVTAAHVPHAIWSRYKFWMLGLTFALLGCVFLPGVGGLDVGLNGARRWLKLGGFFFQPSEMAKLTLAIFVAGYSAEDRDRLRTFWRGFVPLFGVVGAASAMILLEPDVGTALFIAGIMTLTLIVAGIRMLHLIPAMAIAGAAVSGYVMTHMEHVRARVEIWRHPELDPQGKGHQSIQSQIALGDGGLTGVGLGKSTQKLFFLPEVHSDFIFPILGEELGFVGTVSVVVLFVLFGLAGWRIAARAPDRLGFLLSFSVTASIMLQAAMNIAVVTAAIPTKGIPLPFLSSGGSSLLFTMAGIGMLVSVANSGERGEAVAVAVPASTPT